jgi:hypothetical protein
MQTISRQIVQQPLEAQAACNVAMRQMDRLFLIASLKESLPS